MGQKQNIKVEMIDIMKYEWMRLASFGTFPSDSPVHTTRLAEAGFFYQGKDDEVTCFSCGVKYKGWKQDDVPIELHRKISSKCPFINNGECKNFKAVPSFEFGENLSEMGMERKIRAAQIDETEHNHHKRLTTNQKAKDIKEENGACGGPLDVIYPRDNKMSSQTNHNYQTIKQRNNISSQNTGMSKQSVMSQPSSDIGPETVNSITNDVLNNISSSIPAENNHSEMKNKSRTLSKATGRENTLFQLEPLGISFEHPVYPQYAVTTVRHSSFRKWAGDKTQQPEEMAKAGYFHEGVGDRVRCFFCGGGLCNWDPEDDPWIEHARWYPRCVYLRQSKGDAFIYKVQEEVEKGNYDLSHLKDVLNEENLEGQKESSASIQDNDIFSHPAVLSVLDLGARRPLVKKALQIMHITQGRHNLTAEKLLLKVWEIEKQEATRVTNGSTNEAYVINNETTVENISETNKENDEPLMSNLLGDIRDSEIKSETSNIDEAERKAIMEENRHLKELQLCKICLDEDVSIVFLPCGHMATCASCAPALRKCPICRAFIKGTVKAILT